MVCYGRLYILNVSLLIFRLFGVTESCLRVEPSQDVLTNEEFSEPRVQMQTANYRVGYTISLGATKSM